LLEEARLETETGKQRKKSNTGQPCGSGISTLTKKVLTNIYPGKEILEK